MVQHLPEETQQAQSMFEMGLRREDLREVPLDQESSREKQILAEDRQCSWLLKRLFSPYLWLFTSLSVSNSDEDRYLIEAVRKEIVCTYRV